MCMEDVRIGRESTAAEYRVVLPTGTVKQIVPYDKDRIALIISPPDLNTVYLSFSQDPGSGVGFLLSYRAGPLCLSLQEHGDIVRRAIYGISPSGGEVVCAWTATLAKQ